MQKIDPAFFNISEGLNAGVVEAIKIARRTGTKLIVADKDGNPIEITPDEAEAMMNKQNQIN
jgi:translation initiation factor IF-2